MNIAFLTRADLFPPVHGAAVKIVRTAEALHRHGAGVSLVTEDRDTYLRLRGGEWQEVPYPARIRAAEEWPPLPRMGHWAERLLGRLGYPPEEFFLYRPLLDGAWWLRALAVGRLEAVDIFQAEFPGYGVPAWLAARALGGRSAVVQHNVEYDRLRQTAALPRRRWRRLRAIETGILRRVDDVIAVSVEDRELMAAAGVPPTSITVIPHGVELAPFQRATDQETRCRRDIRARYGLSRDAPLLFFHGVLHYGPNLDAIRVLVDELLPRILRHQPATRVIVAGMNPPTYYAHPAVIFPGVVDDLAQHIVAADVAICPLRQGGGTRLKLLEYFAGGRAVVSTAKGAEGLRCRDGREILLREDPDAFATAVLQLLVDEGARRRLGAAARRFAQRYDWSAIGAAYLELYRGRGRGADWNDRLSTPRQPVDAHLPPRRPSKPLTLLLLLNRTCNLSCAFCDLGDVGGSMDLQAQVLPLLDQAVAIGTELLVLTGGEPLLHPDLFTIVRQAKERGMAVNITTNGTLVQRHWQALIHSGLDSISISLDGREAVHDRLRGRPGAYRQALAGLERLARHGGMGVSVYFVVTRENLEELPHVFALSQELGVGFDFWPVNHAPHLALTASQGGRYLEILDQIAASDAAVAQRLDYLRRGLDYHAGSLGAVRCLGLVDQYGVTPEGDLLPCCVWGREELVVGNVFQQPLSELWHGPEARRLRSHLLREGCRAGCFNHSLHEFQQSTGLPFELP